MALTKIFECEVINERNVVRKGINIIGASLFIALCSQIAIPQFFTPVPITLQTFAIALTGWMLGARAGGLAVLAYLIEGGLGFPVFSQGMGGIGVLLSPKGGYLIGFLPAAMVSGFFAKQTFQISKLVLGFTLCSFTIYLLGLSWLTVQVGFEQALNWGFYPFVFGDLIKLAFAICCLKTWEMIGKNPK